MSHRDLGECRWNCRTLCIRWTHKRSRIDGISCTIGLAFSSSLANESLLLTNLLNKRAHLNCVLKLAQCYMLDDLIRATQVLHVSGTHRHVQRQIMNKGLLPSPC